MQGIEAKNKNHKGSDHRKSNHNVKGSRGAETNKSDISKRGLGAFYNVGPILGLGAPIQAKLSIGAADDIYEKEADSVADKVMRMTDDDTTHSSRTPGLSIQRKGCSLCAEDDDTIQRKGDDNQLATVSQGVQSQIQSIRTSGGQPLPHGARNFFEPRFGRDFSDVRVHSGSQAGEAAQGIGAQAFTVGQDIVFNQGKYAPETPRGQHLLAHELTHVVQQSTPAVIQRSAFDTAEQRHSSGNEINIAVQAVTSNYTGIGASWLTTDMVAGIIYAEGIINTDFTDVIGDALGTSDSVGAGQLGSAAIQQVDTSIPQAAHQTFEAQFGAAPSSWRAKAEHSNWAFFYTAGYLAWCMTDAANTFQAVDGAASHIPLGIAKYQGAFRTMRDIRRRIANERGITYPEVTWAMIVEESRGPLSHRERRAMDYAQLGSGKFQFGFQISTSLESRSFHAPERRVRVSSIANYSDSSVTAEPGDFYRIQLIELRRTEETGPMGMAVPGVQLLKHDRVQFLLGQQQFYEWTAGDQDSDYALVITNDNSNEITGEGECKYLY